MKAIVLAGGLGTRLAGYIDGIPKPMARISERPFLEYLLDYLAYQGVRRVVLAVSHRWETIQGYFGDEYAGMRLVYSIEDEPLGTGGAIRQAIGAVDEGDVLVLNGDTLFRIDLDAFAAEHTRSGAMMTMALKRVEDSTRYGRVAVSPGGTVTDFLEKSSSGPGLINGGIYLLNPHLMEAYPMPGKFSFERDLVMPNISRIRPHAFVSDAYFIDMGVPDDLERARREIGDMRH